MCSLELCVTIITSQHTAQHTVCHAFCLLVICDKKDSHTDAAFKVIHMALTGSELQYTWNYDSDSQHAAVPATAETYVLASGHLDSCLMSLAQEFCRNNSTVTGSRLYSFNSSMRKDRESLALLSSSQLWSTVQPPLSNTLHTHRHVCSLYNYHVASLKLHRPIHTQTVVSIWQ